MKNWIQVLIGVLVSLAIVCVFNHAYAGINKDTGEVCQGSDCSEDGGGGTTNNAYGGDGGNANVDLVNKVRNNVDIVNKVNNNTDIVNRVNNDITNRNNNTNTNTAYGGAGYGGDAKANSKATAIVGDINNKNVANGGNANIGDITNKNIANGGNASATGGSAKSIAEGGDGGDANATATGGAGGKADAKASAGDNKGNNQTVNMKFEDKPDLIDPPDAPVVQSKLTDHADKLKIKTMGSVFAMKQHFSYKQAHVLGSGASDVKVENALFVKFNKTNEVHKVDSIPGGVEPMGYIYVLPSGPDCTLAQLEGKLMTAVMEAGGSFFTLDKDSGAYLEGSSWSFGFGGGASVSSSDGTSAIAPSGGTGFGKAKSSNEMRPAVMAAVYGVNKNAETGSLPYIPLDDDGYVGGMR